jgi:Domain of unknown function (DUF4388)
MTVALHGNLRDFGMGEVFQLIGQQRKTGVLEVRGEKGEVTLRFDAGGVVAAAPVGASADEVLIEMTVRCGLVPRDRLPVAEAGPDASPPSARQLVDAGLLSETSLRDIEDLLTRETIFDLLRWSDGSFRFVAQSIPHDRPAESLLGAEQVLMDGLRMVDEWQAFTGELPAETVVFRRRGSIEEYRHSPACRATSSPIEAERVFLLVDGRATVRRVIDLSRLGTFGAMRILVQLARSGWIEPVPVVSAVETRGIALAPTSPARRWAALLAPFAALAVIAGIGLARTASERDVFDLGGDVVSEARSRLATSRVRALVLAYRAAEGYWPDGLDAVARWLGDGSIALTPAETDAYYVGTRIEGPIILAPDRSDRSAPEIADGSPKNR